VTYGQRKQTTKKKKKTADLRSHRYYGSCNTNCGVVCNLKKRVCLVLKDQGGFIETFILSAYVVVFITILAFIMGLGFGVSKQAHAKYGYLGESMTFAASAANMTGGIGGVKENETMAKMLFKAAMEEMEMGNYTLKSFNAVEPGDSVPGGIAKEPGFVAEIIMPISVVNVPLIGEQSVKVPMAYFAVAKSEQLQE
jgi:hypothetical protein